MLKACPFLCQSMVAGGLARTMQRTLNGWPKMADCSAGASSQVIPTVNRTKIISWKINLKIKKIKNQTDCSEIDAGLQTLTARVDGNARVASAVSLLQSLDEQDSAHVTITIAQVFRRNSNQSKETAGIELVIRQYWLIDRPIDTFLCKCKTTQTYTQRRGNNGRTG